MRNISFNLTTPQFIDDSKDVTRRLGWKNVKPGELVRIDVIEVVSIRTEPLNAITQDECRREGFPDYTPAQFVAMFCEHMGCEPTKPVQRIEFRKV